MEANKLKYFFKNCSSQDHRSIIVILGNNGQFQVPVLYQLFAKGNQLSTLWCTKEKLKEIRSDNHSDVQFTENIDASDKKKSKVLPFKPLFCCYSDIEKILCHSFNIAILENFEAIIPSILASIIGTVKRGGIIIFLLSKINDVSELINYKMDFHKITAENKNDFMPRFNRRFAYSLNQCPTCAIVDDKLNILKMPAKSEIPFLIQRNESELSEVKEKHNSDEAIDLLLNQCATLDQYNLLVKFFDVLRKRTYHASVLAASPVSCGKSAALGLAIAGSLVLNYSNIFISSLCYDNVKMVFKYLFKGLDVLGYKENCDYDVIEAVNPEFKNSLIGLNIFKDHPQAVRFVRPTDVKDKLEQAELVIIDEAAAIPSQLLKHFVGPHIVFMSCTTSGFSAVGQNLYSNIINTFGVSAPVELLMQDSTAVAPINSGYQKVTLNEPIHYSSNDSVQSWLNQLLCLHSSISPHLSLGCPHPDQCVLYYVGRDALFSCSQVAEIFLHSLTSLFASSKRKNTSDYLIQLADAPDHHLFCLLPPPTNHKKTNPEILCAIQVHIETKIPKNIVYAASNQKQPLSFCFSDWNLHTECNEEILSVPGVHIIDLVTHPEFQRMGYGLKTVQLLQHFYEGKVISLDESIDVVASSENINSESTLNHEALPLLNKLSVIQPDEANFIFATFGSSPELLKFWKKAGFVCEFITKEVNSSAEHSLYMIKDLGKDSECFSHTLQENSVTFREYFFILLGSECKHFSPAFGLNLLTSSNNSADITESLTKEEIDVLIKPRFMRSLEKYDENQKNLHCIIPIIPVLTKLYFRGRLKHMTLSYVQEAILLCMGLQHKDVDQIAKELTLPTSQIYALLNRTIKRIRKHLTDIIEKSIEKTLADPSTVLMEPLAQDLEKELGAAAAKVKKQLEKTKERLQEGLSSYSIKGSEEEWKSALTQPRKLVSIKRIREPYEDKSVKSTSKGPQKNISKAKSKHGKPKRRK